MEIKTNGETPDFQRIREATHGMMSEESYKDLFELALRAPEGTIVEIGPARGCGTVALALGAMRNEKIKNIYTVDAFEHSNALKSWDDAEENVCELKKNLEAFGCGGAVTVMRAGFEDWDALRAEPVSLLVIDADGALDRDFWNYYDLLIPGAYVIIDDCEMVLNRHARSRYTRERDREQSDPVADAGAYYHKISPLGKEHMTACFVDYLVREGFLIKTAARDSTLTMQKPEGAPAFTEKNKKDMEEIREKTRRLLLSIRAETLRLIREAGPLMEKIRKRTRSGRAVLFKGVRLFRAEDTLFYAIYGTGTPGDEPWTGRMPAEGRIRANTKKNEDWILIRTGRNEDGLHALLLTDRGDGRRGLGLLLKIRLAVKLAGIERRTERCLDGAELGTL